MINVDKPSEIPLWIYTEAANRWYGGGKVPSLPDRWRKLHEDGRLTLGARALLTAVVELANAGIIKEPASLELQAARAGYAKALKDKAFSEKVFEGRCDFLRSIQAAVDAIEKYKELTRG